MCKKINSNWLTTACNSGERTSVATTAPAAGWRRGTPGIQPGQPARGAGCLHFCNRVIRKCLLMLQKKLKAFLYIFISELCYPLTKHTKTHWKNILMFNIPQVRHCVWVLVTQSCPTLCNPMDCSSLGSSVHGILQARTLEWVAIPLSRSSWPRNQTEVSCIAGRLFIIQATRKAPSKTLWLI